MELYNTGIWPEDFTKSVMITIPKKANAVECTDDKLNIACIKTMCFVDFEKAFDRINWVLMLKILRNIGVD
jgi:hypothetical protein